VLCYTAGVYFQLHGSAEAGVGSMKTRQRNTRSGLGIRGCGPARTRWRRSWRQRLRGQPGGLETQAGTGLAGTRATTDRQRESAGGKVNEIQAEEKAKQKKEPKERLGEAGQDAAVKDASWRVVYAGRSGAWLLICRCAPQFTHRFRITKRTK